MLFGPGRAVHSDCGIAVVSPLAFVDIAIAIRGVAGIGTTEHCERLVVRLEVIVDLLGRSIVVVIAARSRKQRFLRRLQLHADMSRVAFDNLSEGVFVKRFFAGFFCVG